VEGDAMNGEKGGGQITGYVSGALSYFQISGGAAYDRPLSRNEDAISQQEPVMATNFHWAVTCRHFANPHANATTGNSSSIIFSAPTTHPGVFDIGVDLLDGPFRPLGYPNLQQPATPNFRRYPSPPAKLSLSSRSTKVFCRSGRPP
jgi:hypothetical protein